MVKTMTFSVKKIDPPNRASDQVSSPAALRSDVTCAAKRQPKQQ